MRARAVTTATLWFPRMADFESPPPVSQSVSPPIPRPDLTPIRQRDVAREDADAAFRKWDWARTQVRLCAYPDEPRLIEHFLDLGRHMLAQQRMSAWDLAWQSAQLLLDTAADRALPPHWRTLCLDHLYIPLDELARHADSAERQQRLAGLRWRLATLHLESRGGELRPPALD